MDYLIGSSVSTDEVHLPDGTIIPEIPGGAGIYALAGIRLWSDSVIIASGVGPDYLSRHQWWYTDNRLTTEGLVLRGNATPTTVITYYENGERVDEPNVGLAEFRRMDPTLEDLRRCCGASTKGVYVFRDWNPAFFEGLFELKRKLRFQLMWEISEDAAIPENREEIERALPQIDVFSLNQKEAAQLYGGPEPVRAVKKLARACGGWVYLRRGKAGASLFANGHGVSCPSVEDAEAVDVTGAGNSSSAAVLYAYCEGVPAALAAAMGAVSAAHIIAQYGPPKIYTPTMRTEAEQKAATLRRRVTEEDLNDQL